MNAFKINGTSLTLQPSSHKWLGRDNLGADGLGHPMYPAVREYELRWDAMTPAEFAQVQGFYDFVSSTGTVVVDLPKYANSTYSFYTYSGCVLQEPSFGGYFEENLQDVTLLILNIRT